MLNIIFIRELQIKQWDASILLLECLRLKITYMSNGWWQCRPKGTLVSGRNAKWHIHFRRQFVIFLRNWIQSHCKIQQVHSWIFLSNWYRNLGTHKNLHMNAHSCLFDKCQNLEATKTFFNRWTDKLWHRLTIDHQSSIKKNDLWDVQRLEWLLNVYC